MFLTFRGRLVSLLYSYIHLPKNWPVLTDLKVLKLRTFLKKKKKDINILNATAVSLFKCSGWFSSFNSYYFVFQYSNTCNHQVICILAPLHAEKKKSAFILLKIYFYQWTFSIKWGNYIYLRLYIYINPVIKSAWISLRWNCSSRWGF